MKCCVICSSLTASISAKASPQATCASDQGTANSGTVPAGVGVSPCATVTLDMTPSSMLCDMCQRLRPSAPQEVRSIRRTKNVLALDGGGLRGVFTLVILQRIVKLAGKPIRELFDLIVGCSAGGLLACGLGVLDLDCDAGLDLFLQLGGEAFVARETKASAVAKRVGISSTPTFSHKYRHENLEHKLKQHLGHDTVLQLDEPKIAVLALQWNVTPRKPVLFRSYPRPEGSTLDGPPAGSVALWEAARATAAAPTYFRPIEIRDDWYVDGGLTANDPSMAALAEATALYGIDGINVLLSLGTGFVEETKRKVNPDPWIWNLANDVVMSCIQSQAAMSQAAMNATLNDRYVRINGPIEKGTMDDQHLMESWVESATAWVDDERNRETLELLVARLVSAK